VTKGAGKPNFFYQTNTRALGYNVLGLSVIVNVS